MTAFLGEGKKILNEAEVSHLFRQASGLEQTIWGVIFPGGQNKHKFTLSVSRVKVNPWLLPLQESIRHINVTSCPNLCWSSLCWQNSSESLRTRPLQVFCGICHQGLSSSSLWEQNCFVQDIPQSLSRTKLRIMWRPNHPDLWAVTVLNHSCFVAR